MNAEYEAGYRYFSLQALLFLYKTLNAGSRNKRYLHEHYAF